MPDASQLEQLLKFLTETLQQTKDFTIEQAPQVVKEFLWWQFYSSAFWLAFFILTGIIGATLVPKCINTLFENNEHDSMACRWFFRTASAFAIATAICVCGSTMVKIKVAPRVVVLETVRDMIAGARR